MKQLFIALWAVLLPALAAAQDLAALDTENGYQGQTFGTRFEAFTGFVQVDTKIENEGIITHYTKPTEPATFAGAIPKQVQYGFYKGQLYTVSVVLQPGKHGGVFTELVKRYGEPTLVDGHTYYWQGRNVFMTYTDNPETSGASIYLLSEPIFGRKKADKKALAK